MTARIVSFEDVDLVDSGTKFMGKRVFIESTGNTDRDQVRMQRWKKMMEEYMIREQGIYPK